MDTQAQTTVADARELAREIFLDDLDMPLESAIAIIAEQTGTSLSLDDISRLRSDVSQTIARALPPQESMLVVQREPFNKPRFVTGSKQTRTESAMARRGRALVDVTEKRKWLNDWALEKGGMATIKEAKEALLAKFGEGLGTSYVARTLKDARQLLLDDRRSRQPLAQLVESHPLAAVPSVEGNSVLETVRSIANLMRISKIKRIAIDADGSISYEASA